MISLKIFTCNSHKDPLGKEDGGFHEIHEIGNLRSIDHAIYNILAIVSGNIIYSSEDSKLTGIVIYCNNAAWTKELRKYFDAHKILNVEIEINYQP